MATASNSHTILFACLFWPGLISVGISQTNELPSSLSTDAAVASLLRDRCLGCHSDRKTEGGYNLSRIDLLQKPGDSGKLPVGVQPTDESELIQRITSEDESTRMPSQSPKLTDAEIALISNWLQSSTLLRSDNRSSIVDLAAGNESLIDLTNAPIFPIYPNRVPTPVICLDAKNHRLYVGGVHEVIVWDSVEHRIVERWTGLGRTVSSIQCDATGQWIAVASGQPGKKGTVHVVQQKQSHMGRLVVNLSDLPFSLSFSPVEPILAVGGLDGSLMLFDVSQGTRLMEVTAHADQVLALAWKSDGRQFMSGSRDRTARVYDFPSLELKSSYSGHERSVGAVAILELGAVTLDETGTLRLWSINDSDRVLAKRKGLPQMLQSLFHDESSLIWLDDRRMDVVLLQRREVEEGKDDAGKPKTKKIHEFIFSKSIPVPLDDAVVAWTVNRETKEILIVNRNGWVQSIPESDAGSNVESRWRLFP